MVEKTTPEKMSSWLKFGLLAAFPAYLFIDLGIGYINGENRRAYREALCFQFEDNADEAIRQRDLPVTVLGKFDHFLKCGNIKEISVLGGKISNDRIIASKKEETEEGVATLSAIADLQRQLDDVRPTMTTSADISSIAALNTTLENTRVQIAQSVQVSEQKIVQLEQKIPELLPQSSQWAVIAGADKGDQAALDQAKAIQKIATKYETSTRSPTAHGAVQLLLRNGFFRTAILYGSREDALKAYEAIQSDLKYGSYVRDLDSWCPDATVLDNIGAFSVSECRL